MRTKTPGVTTVSFTCQPDLAQRIDAELESLRRKFPGRIISRSQMIACALDEALPQREEPRHRDRVSEGRSAA